MFRKTSKRGEPRQLFCGIGRCTDCVMIVDGQPNVRTCVTPVREGMRVEVQDGRGVWDRPRGESAASRAERRERGGWASRAARATAGRRVRRVDVAVVGAGPAGLCAAAEAARHGCEVALLDENATAGGQLFKQIHKFFGSRRHRAGRRGIDIGAELLDDVAKLGVHVCLGAPVWGLYEGRTVAVAEDDRSWRLGAGAIVLATGATENGLAFPAGRCRASWAPGACRR